MAVLRSRWVRAGFVLVAVSAAVVAVVQQRAEIADAVTQVPPAAVGAALVVSVAYVVCTMLSWRAVLADLGSRLPVTQAFGLFGVSQLGKYVPGGVWNIVAAGELGADLAIPRRRSMSAMAVAVLVSVVSGLALGLPALAVADTHALDLWWLWLVAPLCVAALVPPVLNRLLAAAMRLARREPLEHPLTTRGTLVATAWALLGWVVVGAQVWLLAAALGVPATPSSFLLAVGAYALAWVVGFLVVVTPPGSGPASSSWAR